jgi:TonB family protein
MDSLHSFTHGTLALSAPFLFTLIALSVTITAIALVPPRTKRLSAASRHLILSLAVLLPLLAGALAAADARGLLRRLVAADEVAPAASATSALDLSSMHPAAAPSEAACVLLIVWAVGAAFFVSSSVRTSLRWKRAADNAEDVRDERVLLLFGRLTLGGHVLPRLATSAEASEPMVVGFLRPVILLPVSYSDLLSNSELTAVFAHELEHVRRRDNITAALHELVCALFWFDPTKWIARRLLLDLRERACDERVLDLGCEPEPYLTALARSCHAAIDSPVVACMSGFHVRERMESIMIYSSVRKQFLPGSAVRTGSAVAAVTLALSFAFFSPQPAVAASGSGSYALDVTMRPAAAGKMLVDISVVDPDGERVMRSQTVATPGVALRSSAAQGDRSFNVRVVPSATENSSATLEVREDDELVFTSTVNVPPYAAPAPLVTGAPPISLHLQDADLHDVLRTFSQMTGRQITAAPGVSASITVDVVDVPWDQALLQAIAPHGLTAVVEGNDIRVVKAPAPTVNASHADEYRPLGQGITRPEVVTQIEPVYTPEAKAQRVSGVVIIQASIDDTGAVRETKILKPMPFGLSQAAADAVKQWKFKPAMLDGKPVPVKFTVTINFRPDGA